ncbi:MAG TPA: GMC oxidoreductase [Thermoanaerobaculia bacterium]|jgi:cholesterol oxidase|nr:GMC oxidoreductase [Thermoanaerobaculia bacterium]
MPFDYIIIGSGFGGSVSACRLAQKGAKVLVLERGRRWDERKDYPVKESWIFAPDHPEKLNGWLDFRLFGKMNVVQGAGVGGGSLVYANISVEARPDVFDKGWPAEITYKGLKPYYERVAKFMNVQRVPPSQVPERFKLMKRAAEAKGWGDRFMPVELCVEFDQKYDLANWDMTDNAQKFSVRSKNQHGVEIGTCVHCGNCDIGCKYGAKSTLDKNYIPVAEMAGAEFRPLHLVRAIEPQNGGYVVRFDRIVNGALVPGQETARRVIVAAGSLGSTELLLRCRDEHKTLRNVSDFLGRNWTSNGDFLTPAMYKDYKPYPHRGPTITSAIDFGDGAYKNERFWIEDGGYPNLIVNYLRHFDTKTARTIAKALENVFDDNVMPWFAQGVDRGDGRLYLGREWLTPWKKRLKLDWKAKANAALFNAISDMHHELSAATGGKPEFEMLWKQFKTVITPHPLGGCNIGTSAANGVVDHMGEVFGHPGLYVCDGAIIPVPIGRNPTRTIAALAERFAENLH